jgi:hypothetical protein
MQDRAANPAHLLILFAYVLLGPQKAMVEIEFIAHFDIFSSSHSISRGNINKTIKTRQKTTTA